VVRLHTVASVLTWAAACGTPAGSKNTPIEPPNPPVGTKPIDAAVAIDAPEPPKLACDAGTKAMPAPAPEPTWFCTREDGTRHGPFITVFPDNAIEIRGAYKDGALEGPWERHHLITGAVVEHGEYVAGKKHGTWQQSNPQGSALGEYEMTAGTGIEKRWLDDGTLYSEIAFKAGVLDGTRKVYAKTTVIETARYKAGKLDGPHVFGTHNTMRFEEGFTNGVRRGTRRIFHQGSLIADERYDRAGRLDGPYASWRSGKIKRVEGAFSSGRRTGTWVWLDKDGKTEREGAYSGGRKTGDWAEFVEEKLVFSGSYSYGKPHGTFIYFAKNGNELGRFSISGGTGWMLTFWNNGKPSTKQHVYKGVEDGVYQELTKLGKVVVEGHYASGIRHGTWKEWTADGLPLSEQSFNRGKQEGVVKKFIDGKLATQTTYVDGKAEGDYTEYRLDKPAVTGAFVGDLRAGTWTHYNPEGNVVRIATYKAGVLEGPYRELANGVVSEGQMVAGRRSGTWTRTDKAGSVRKLTYRTP
jgi:antitoxin component YwqK of YwqJK toxin-antitoxin module